MTPDALQDLSRREALRALTARLHAGGVAEAAGDARFLLLGILGLETRDLLIEGGRRLGPADAASLAAACTDREAFFKKHRLVPFPSLAFQTPRGAQA